NVVAKIGGVDTGTAATVVHPVTAPGSGVTLRYRPVLSPEKENVMLTSSRTQSVHAACSSVPPAASTWTLVIRTRGPSTTQAVPPLTTRQLSNTKSDVSAAVRPSVPAMLNSQSRYVNRRDDMLGLTGPPKRQRLKAKSVPQEWVAYVLLNPSG